MKRNGAARVVSSGRLMSGARAVVGDADIHKSERAESGEYDNSRPVTAAEVAAIVREVISGMKIYVLESDITQAQNAVKGVVEQSYF